MPELPEVETIARAVRRSLDGAVLLDSNFFRKDIRTPIPKQKIQSHLHGQRVTAITRRSKYLLIDTSSGTGLFHLGMSGVIDINSSPTPQVKHTHAIFRFRCTDGQERFLHFVDPRRFGKIGFIHPGAEARESEFKDLGVEPLDETVALGDYLWKQSRNKSAPIKNFIMDQRVVVGVGNIYASESLFRARISPLKSANKVTRACYEQLAASIRETLSDAIEQGGTSFRDFRHVDGTKGYFEVKLNVYGRVGQSCSACNGMIRQIRQSGRSTFYCPRCQR